MNKARAVEVRMADMGAADAARWDARLGPKHAVMPTCADRFWSWSVLLPMCHLVQLAKLRSCRPLVIWARSDSGRFLRVGMSILIEATPTWIPAARWPQNSSGSSARRTLVSCKRISP